tara:strand:+ start:305 stop:511 length:207 start_codon:yes stop_codon:yes gene_type:complete
MNQFITWRATINLQNQQMTFEFKAPSYNPNINYSHLARVEFVRMLRDLPSQATITNVEPVERYAYENL